MSVKNGGNRGKKPQHTLLSGVDCAGRLGVSTKWLRALAKQGVLPREGQLYPWPAVRVAYDKYLEQKRGEVGDFRTERAALIRVQRELMELKVAERRGELVPVKQVVDDYGRILERLRARILNAPGKYAHRTVGLKTLAKSRAIWNETVAEFIDQLRSRYVDESRKSPAGR